MARYDGPLRGSALQWNSPRIRGGRKAAVAAVEAAEVNNLQAMLLLFIGDCGDRLGGLSLGSVNLHSL